jgi:hypothetical protein
VQKTFEDIVKGKEEVKTRKNKSLLVDRHFIFSIIFCFVVFRIKRYKRIFWMC